MEVLHEADRYVPPEELRPRWRNVPQRHVDRGAAVKRIDHVNLLAADVAGQPRPSPRTRSGFAPTSR